MLYGIFIVIFAVFHYKYSTYCLIEGMPIKHKTTSKIDHIPHVQRIRESRLVKVNCNSWLRKYFYSERAISMTRQKTKAKHWQTKEGNTSKRRQITKRRIKCLPHVTVSKQCNCSIRKFMYNYQFNRSYILKTNHLIGCI